MLVSTSATKDTSTLNKCCIHKYFFPNIHRHTVISLITFILSSFKLCINFLLLRQKGVFSLPWHVWTFTVEFIRIWSQGKEQNQIHSAFLGNSKARVELCCTFKAYEITQLMFSCMNCVWTRPANHEEATGPKALPTICFLRGWPTYTNLFVSLPPSV